MVTHDWLTNPPFIVTPRARAACQRQRSYFFAAVAKRVKVLQQSGPTEAAVVCASPDRYIAQIGPVALTVVWLRSALDSVAEGQLLVIVWRGTVGPQRGLDAEREGVRPTKTATILWEDVVVVSAESEESWRWCPVAEDKGGYTSDQLAERCVDRLRVAYADIRRD
jgi:hypothetical protein